MKRTVVVLGLLIVLLLGAGTGLCFAGDCKHEHAECEINNSNKMCCSGLVCVPFNAQSGNGKCEKETAPPPVCGANASGDPCVCNDGFDGDPLVGCTPIVIPPPLDPPTTNPPALPPPATQKQVLLPVTGVG